MSTASKPRSEAILPEITRLPERSLGRRILRGLLRIVLKLVVWLFTSTEVSGLENTPQDGPLLMVSNHLGDADAIVGLAFTPRPVEVIAKSELYHIPMFGKLVDAYGVIWVHRGQPDRRALRVTLDALKQGRAVAIAPEGRESLTGGLEEGTGGAAYIAYKSKAPILPVTMTGTENRRLLENIKRFKRTRVTMTIGPPFYLDDYPDRREAVSQGTLQIMQALARQLPPQYQGVFKEGDAPGMDRPIQQPQSKRAQDDG